MTENTARELPTDLQEAEAIARADESRASIMRRKALTDPAYKDASNEAATAARESSEHYAKLQGEADGRPKDLSGAMRTLSDSAGNFAPNIEVAQAGGTGVEASNTNVSTGEQAQTGEEAGEVVIAPDWEGQHWRTRVALAEKISGRTDVKSEDANEIISAEIARRG